MLGRTRRDVKHEFQVLIDRRMLTADSRSIDCRIKWPVVASYAIQRMGRRPPTAGHNPHAPKDNSQLPEDSEAAKKLGDTILAALENKYPVHGRSAAFESLSPAL